MVAMDVFASAFGLDDKSKESWTTLGKVTAVSGNTLSVLLGGSSTPTECESYCAASVGDIVLVVIMNGHARAVAVKGGDVADIEGRLSTAETEIVHLMYPQVSEAIQEAAIDVGNWSVFKGFHVGNLYVGVYYDTWNKFKDGNGNYIDCTTQTGSMYVSDDYMSRPLPCPTEPGSFAIFGTTYWGNYTQRFSTLTISGLDRPDSSYEYGSQVRFKMGSSVQIDNSASFDFAIKLLVVATRAHIRQSPRIAYSASRNTTVISCARSYLQARQNGRNFAYGLNWSYGTTNALNDSQGRGLGECDTLAFLSASGIAYSDSPYTTTTASATVDRTTVTYPKDTWAKDEPKLGTWVSYLSAQVWYFIYNNLAFSDKTQVKDGDFVVFRGGEGTTNAYRTFDSCTHIGIVYWDANNKLRMIHWTSGSTRDPEGYKIRDDDFDWYLTSVERSLYSDADSYYFARLPMND